MRCLSALLVILISLPAVPVTAAPAELNIVVIEGEGATNNIRQRVAREPIVQVEDENHKPVAGAVVVFTLPTHGAGGTFANGAHTLTATTNDQGQAIGRGFQANGAKGPYQIRVNASRNGQTASATISMVNVAAGAVTGAAGGVSGKLIAIIAVVGAAAAGGAIAAVKAGGGGGNNGATAASLTTITPGSITVGPPK